MLFIHIPKTAGNSIASCGVKPFGHKKLNEFQLNKTETVMTVVRNPYDRAVSTYYYIKQCHQNAGEYCPTQDNDVNEWWSAIYANRHTFIKCRKPLCYYEQQIEFLNDYKGGGLSERVDHILRYESLELDWSAFASKHGLSDLPHKNKSKLREDKHWSEELTDETITLINDLYAQDFAELGYDMITKKKMNSEFEAVSNNNMMQSAMQERQKVVAAKLKNKSPVKNNKVYPKPTGENLFIHIPKAAGSSIWATTGMKMEMHKELKFMTGRVKPDTFVFASIRNPYDRAVSLYYYLRTRIRKRTCRDWNAAMCCLAQGVDVNEFWLKFITPQQFKFQCKAFPMMRPQTDFLEDQESVISTRIDKILKVENLQQEWEELRAIRGFKPLAKRNVGRNRAEIPWQEELNPETIEHLSNLYDKDFKCLPYNKHNAY